MEEQKALDELAKNISFAKEKLGLDALKQTNNNINNVESKTDYDKHFAINSDMPEIENNEHSAINNDIVRVRTNLDITKTNSYPEVKEQPVTFTSNISSGSPINNNAAYGAILMVMEILSLIFLVSLITFVALRGIM